jgi:hypothetical protein
MKTVKFSILLAFVIFFSSCANTYKTINPKSLNYANRQKCNNKLEVAYIYDIYSLTDNARYSKKEKNNNYRTIAIRIKNISDSTRVLTKENFRIYANDIELKSPNNLDYLSTVKQLSALFLLHAFWGPVKVETWTDSNGNSGGKTTYLPIGLAVGLVNTIIAASANSKHEEEIKSSEIYGIALKPNETFYGIVVLNYSQYDPLSFRYFDK